MPILSFFLDPARAVFYWLQPNLLPGPPTTFLAPCPYLLLNPKRTQPGPFSEMHLRAARFFPTFGICRVCFTSDEGLPPK